MDEREIIKGWKNTQKLYSITIEGCVGKVKLNNEPTIKDLINGEIFYM